MYNKLELPKFEISSGKNVQHRITDRQIDSYAKACIAASKIIVEVKPDVILCPLRGAYPPTRAVFDTTEGEYDIEYTPASGFLANKEEFIYSALEKIIKGKARKILTIDTCISGSSIRYFRRLLKEFIPQIMNRNLSDSVDYYLLKLWQGKEFDSASSDSRKYTERFSIHDHNILLDDLFCEDKPVLLGIDYPNRLEKHGKKSAFIGRVNAKEKISVVGEKNIDYFPEDGASTADLFVDLVVDRIKEIKQESDTNSSKQK